MLLLHGSMESIEALSRHSKALFCGKFGSVLSTPDQHSTSWPKTGQTACLSEHQTCLGQGPWLKIGKHPSDCDVSIALVTAHFIWAEKFI